MVVRRSGVIISKLIGFIGVDYHVWLAVSDRDGFFWAVVYRIGFTCAAFVHSVWIVLVPPVRSVCRSPDDLSVAVSAGQAVIPVKGVTYGSEFPVIGQRRMRG